METNRWIALGWISIAVLFALSLWFSASVIIDELIILWNLSNLTKAWVSAAVPIGFVVGAFISSYFGISDRYPARKIFAISALLGALFNFFIIFVEQAYLGVTLRFLTGVTLAGVYPVAVKMIAGWFPTKRGLAIGILIAALTLGTSLPHFVVIFFSGFQWQIVIGVSSILAVIAAAIVHWILTDAPGAGSKSVFSFKLIKKVITNKPVMLANYGYFGHMWELYAMWTWLPFFLSASFLHFSPNTSPWLSPLFSFISIGIAGALGCVIGGYFADKIGRARLTIIALAVSGLCAIGIGFSFGHSLWLPILISVIWGIFVIADSAQFSAAVSEFADTEYVGTALTFQMCIGFLITMFSINIVPFLQEHIGWEWVFTILAIGPVLGIVSMLRFYRYEMNNL